MNAQTLAAQLQYLQSELRALKLRMAQFEGITGIAAGPTDVVDITASVYDSGTRRTALSWLHAAGATYRVELTSDLGTTWNTVTGGENIAAATSGVVTLWETPALASGHGTTFYRVRRNPYVCTPAVS